MTASCCRRAGVRIVTWETDIHRYAYAAVDVTLVEGYPRPGGTEVEEALVFLDRHGRYVTATTTALQLLHVADRELASFRVVRGQVSDSHGFADWGSLAERGPGIGESLLVSPGGERYEVTVLVTHIPTGWQLTIEPLDRPAQEPGVMRRSPEVLAAWRGAERRLADGDESDVAREVDRLRRQYGQLTAHLLGEADEAVDAATRNDRAGRGSAEPG